MDTKKIKTLIKLLKESDLSALEVVEGDSKIRLERSEAAPMGFAPASSASVAPPARPLAKLPDEVDFNKISELKAPLIGIFYAAPSPKDKPFVEIGSRVKKGDVLCIIEAMKFMNEITSDRDGEIIDICVQDGQVVEFSQVLFKIF